MDAQMNIRNIENRKNYSQQPMSIYPLVCEWYIKVYFIYLFQISNKCIRNRQGKQYWSTSLLSLYLIIFVGLLFKKKRMFRWPKRQHFLQVTCHGKNMLLLLFLAPNSTLPFLFDTCSIFFPVNCQPWQGSCYIPTYFVHLKISKFSRFFSFRKIEVMF